jgi:hypothetical protein
VEYIVPAFCQLYLLLFVLTSVQNLSDIRKGCTARASHVRSFKHVQKGGAIEINVAFFFLLCFENVICFSCNCIFWPDISILGRRGGGVTYSGFKKITDPVLILRSLGPLGQSLFEKLTRGWFLTTNAKMMWDSD